MFDMDEVLEMLETHSDAEVAEHFGLTLEEVEQLGWFWVED